jgi:hypothetical protein
MDTYELLESLARRGMSVSVEGERLKATPASLLTDEDRRLIQQYKAELVELLSESEAEVTDSPTEPQVAVRLSPFMYQRPEEIGLWPIPDRQRWGELANQLIDEGMSWQEAERVAYETVRAERKVTGEIFLIQAVRSDPDPFPDWDDLIDPRAYLADPPRQPRPPGRPTWGVTHSIRVVELSSWTPARQSKDPIKCVTAEGWDKWYPLEDGDLPFVARAPERRDAPSEQTSFIDH